MSHLCAQVGKNYWFYNRAVEKTLAKFKQAEYSLSLFSDIEQSPELFMPA